MRESLWRAAIVALLIAGLGVFAGCFNNDENSEQSATVAEVQDELAEGVAETSVSVMLGMIEVIGELDEGGAQPALRDDEFSATWNTDEQAWYVTGSSDYDEEDVTGQVAFTYRVQFLADGTPQQNTDDLTDEVDVALTASNAGNYHPADKEWDVDFDWNATSDMHATLGSDQSVAITGGGAIDGAVEIHVGGGQITDETHADWTYDLALASGADCPTGTLQGSHDQYSYQADLDAAGNVNWQIFENGELIGSGTDVACEPSGTPAGTLRSIAQAVHP